MLLSCLVGVRIERVDLPGIGTRSDILTRGGRRLSIVTHRTGEREIAVHGMDDPDACVAAIPLTDDEATAVGEILGAAVTLSKLSSLGVSNLGLFTEEIALPADSGFVGRPMGATKARTMTGSSIVAIARDEGVIPSPGPGTVFEAGDIVVAVGTRKGLDALTEIFDRGPR